MKRLKLYIRQIAVILMVLPVVACEDMMVTDPTTSLNAEDHFSENNEVYGAFIGLWAGFNRVAEQTIILSELKGDLMTPTMTAPEEFWNIYRYQADNNSPYCSSKNYYDLVINCNDFLRRAVKYNQKFAGSIPDKVYSGMISQAIDLKVWALFTIGKYWGEASVYDTNLENNAQNVMVTLKLDQLIPYLMAYLTGGEDGVDGFQELDWKLVLDNKNINWEGSTFEGNVLMGELNLWAGNYQTALDYLIRVIRLEQDVNKKDVYTHAVTNVYGGGYWSRIFSEIPVNIAQEVITLAPFNANYGQQHKLNYYFSNAYPNVYYLAPSDRAIKLFESQVMNEANGYYLGDRTRGNTTYWKLSGGNRIEKYNLSNKDGNQYANDASIHVYRAAQIHLNIAEAYCCLGKYEEAIAFLDGGLKSYWSDLSKDFKAPFTGMDKVFKENLGIRNRVNLLALNQKEIFAVCSTQTDSIQTLCGLIVDEVALELAYEGKRWETLVRMARNFNQPSFLSTRVSKKFESGVVGFYKTLLDNPENWFIKEVLNSTLK